MFFPPPSFHPLGPKRVNPLKGPGRLMPRSPWRRRLLPISGPPPTRFASYLQPGVVVVCPGGWHFAPPSFGPLLLLPGPKSGSANATPPNDIDSANMSAAINNEMRLRIRFLSSLIVL